MRLFLEQILISEDFWNKFSKVVHELAPINKNLIQKKRDYSKKNR